jgi:hypothetical protein
MMTHRADSARNDQRLRLLAAVATILIPALAVAMIAALWLVR